MQNIRSIYYDVQIIFISGYSDKEYLKSAILLSAINYVDKPININELEKAVTKATEEIKKNKIIYNYQTIGKGVEAENSDFTGVVALVQKYISSNYADKDLSIKKLADVVFLTPTYLSSLYKKKTNKTISEYIVEIRMEKAKALLTDVGLKLYIISDMVGYEDSVYFSKIFKKYTGCTPSSYRDKIL